MLFTGLFLANVSHAAHPIEITASDDGTKYYVLPDTKTSIGIWVRIENPKFKKLKGAFVSDAFLEFNCQHRSFSKGWVRAIDFNGQILLNERLNDSLTPLVPDTTIAQLFNFVCSHKQ